MKSVTALVAVVFLLAGGSALAQDDAAPAAAPAAESTEAPAAEAPKEAPAAPVKPMPAEIMPLAAKSLLLDVINTGERLVAVGDRGDIVVSLDGEQWAQVNVPVRSPLTAVAFADAKNGWAVGHDATILSTKDGGRTWTLQNFEPELEKPFLDVLFLDAQRGFAVGAYGLFYQTSDGGGNWAPVESEIRTDELHFNSITRLNNGDLFIAGEQGTLALSSDSGATWSKLTSPYDASLFGALAQGEKGAVIFGLRGNVYVSDDVRGGQWKKLESGTVASMFGGTLLKDGRVALVGLNGVILLADAGGNVKLLQTPSGTSLSGVVPLDGQLLAVGESGAQRIAVK
jgi:photosystem II stability/assembly factor-like uncharacterized protein